MRLIREQRSDDCAVDRLRAEQFARGAMDVANHDPAVLVNAAYAPSYLGEDIGAMIALSIGRRGRTRFSHAAGT